MPDKPESIPQKIHLNPITLSFKGKCQDLEQVFINNYNTKSLNHIRISLFLGLILYAVFGFLDVSLVPEQKTQLWLIRYAVVCPCILISILLSLIPGFKKYMQVCLVFLMILAGSGISIMVAIANPPANYSYYAGVILVLMMSYGFIKARFIWACLTGWMNVLFYEIVAIWIVQTPGDVLLNNNFFFISANIIGMFICYSSELYARTSYYMALQLEFTQKKTMTLNNELEHRIKERVADINKTNERLHKEIEAHKKEKEERKQAEKSSEKIMIQLKSLWNITKIADSDIKNISDHVLTEVQKMTQSRYAFYGLLSEDEQEMILHAWSNETMNDCRTNEKTLHFAIQKAGIWAEAVRNRKILTINDFTVEHEGKKGVPDGHVPLTRLMVVPLIKDKKVISIVAVANKKENYSNDDEQQVKAFLGNIQILIDRKKAEKALIESEKKWRNILVNTPQIGISLTPMGRIVFANDHFLRITGWEKEEVINQNWFDLFILSGIREEIREVFHSTLIRKESLDFSTYENEILTKSGGLLSIAWSNVVNQDANGEVLDITCLGVDLTERVRAEKEMAKQKRLFETMFNTIPDGVVITDTERMIQLANNGMKLTFGYNPEDLLGKSTKILYGDQNEYDITGRNIFAQNAKKQNHLYVTRYKDSTGKEFSGETFGAKLFDESNQWIGNLGIMRDITERQQVEMRLQQAQKMESIGTLAGGIAHDFNNILFPIVGHTEMLLEDIPDESPYRESIKEIYKGSLRARDLVQQILAFSRQETHDLKLMKMQPIIKEALKLIRSTISTTISINQNIQSDCGVVKADPTQIHQIVMNLTTNAYHAMEENGGELKVSLKEVGLGTFDLISPDMAPGSYACLTIADTGTGMDKNTMDKIFDPFFTTKEKGKGTGMGLSVVHGIVKSMNGEIKVYSEPGRGTQFYIYLPVIKTSSIKEETRTNEAIQGGNESVLLVDDEKAIIAMEKQALERLGYQVTSSTSSLEALEAFRTNPDKFDLIITDKAMPNMPGEKLAAELMKIRPNIPILLCTGFSESMSEEKIKSIGIKGFLLKPIIIKDLAQKMREILDK